jgi:PTH1 family peptidyl-tRNA hydrolase
MDIELGKYKLSIDSTSAGHNGVKSIINYLKTKNFKRIRIGIKNENSLNIPTEKFVLQNFNKEELEIINYQIAQISTELL